MSVILEAKDVSKTFRRGRELTHALTSFSLTAEAGEILCLLGPDGSGKTTFLRLLTGLLQPDSGTIRVLGYDTVADAEKVQSSIGYMPQKFGLYEDLTVMENMRLCAEMRAVPAEIRSERFRTLLEMTDLTKFTERLAGRLSGGMKQKLALACTLVSDPKLILLDEPTVGVDPLSRRELWQLLKHFSVERKITILVSTAYMDEAMYGSRALILYQGEILRSAPPGEIADSAAKYTFDVPVPQGTKPRRLRKYLCDLPATIHASVQGETVRWVIDPGSKVFHALRELSPKPGKPCFEDGFMTTLFFHLHPDGADTDGIGQPFNPAQQDTSKNETIVEVKDLVRTFGSFVAVDHVSFQVRAGEIFGLLGPNGAGKSTTFRMLCGLLPLNGGSLEVAGVDLHTASAKARRKLGYVAQKFSLYRDLSTRENLNFFAGAYGLRGAHRKQRIEWAIQNFQLEKYIDLPAGELPGGYKQRLSMACGLMHEPQILFLDEPTSGADPWARRDFWQRIGALADSGVTIIITTHFLDEAEFCDSMVIMMAGRVLAKGTPAEIRKLAPAPADGSTPSLQDAFIAVTEKERKGGAAI